MRENVLMDPGNNLRQVREARMLSKAELARQAGISPLTIDRIEKGMPCRIATRRKILLALGLKLSQWRTTLGRTEALTFCRQSVGWMRTIGMHEVMALTQ